MPLGVTARRPADAVQQGDGTFKRPVTLYKPSGTPYQSTKTVCEECWEIMPRYTTAPSGWVAPDSASKTRPVMYEGHSGIEAIPKLVCYSCLKRLFLAHEPEGVEFPDSIDDTVDDE